MTHASAIDSRTLPVMRQKYSQMTAVLYLLLATMALFPHFIVCASVGAVGLTFIVLITLGGLVLSVEFAFALLIVCLFLQNLFIAIVTPLAAGTERFEPMLGTSFINVILTSAYSAIVWLKIRRDMPEDNQKLLFSMVLFFVVVTIYTGLGTVNASLNDALIYARVYIVGGLLLTIGIAFGSRLPAPAIVNVLKAMSFFLALWGVLEFCFTYGMYSLFHIADYIHLKYASAVSMDVTNVQQAIEFANRSYLNLSGALGLNVDLLRPQGPNIHPISYAYALAFGAIVCYINRAAFVMVMCLALLLLVGAKGPIIMAFLSIALSILYGIRPRRNLVLAILVVCMFLYAAVGIAYGLYTEDYHVVGFMGGVHGFMANPIGHGVGVGGNLSTMAVQYQNFSLFQGYGADFALESGFGVMIYQIGLGTIAFLFFYWRLWKSVWKAVIHFADEPRQIALPCALAILLVNSIFQEEAFSPAGWGPLMMLSGLLLARYWHDRDSLLLKAN